MKISKQARIVALGSILFFLICAYLYADRWESEKRKGRWLADHKCSQISADEFKCDTGVVKKSTL